MKKGYRPEEIKTNEICDYGCGNIAKFKFSNGKICCSTSGANCPERRKAATQKRNKKMSIIGEDGLSGWERNAKNIAEIKYNKINTEGLNVHQISAQKSAITMKEKIMDDGRSQSKHISEKAHNTIKSTIMDDGRTLREHLNEKQSNTMLNITSSGLTEAQRRSEISNIKKFSNIDENGLNGFDRAACKFKGTRYFLENKKFYIQSSYEEKFLLQIMNNNNITIDILDTIIKRGPTIHYTYENRKRWYVSDFIINNTIYEIKSDYTWFYDLERNKIKLNAALEAGYKVKLMLDGIELDYPTQQPTNPKRVKKF